MSRRPIQHVIGDQGVAEISRILSNAGWACENVRADYGEDLICQTTHNGLVDPHRILVQIKSTRRRILNKNSRLRIAKDTLLKWLSDSNLVIVCLWSISEKVALYQNPSDQFGLFDIDLSDKRFFDLLMPASNVLNENVAEVIAWRSRLRNINRHFLETKNNLDYLHSGQFDHEEEYSEAKKELQQNLTAITIKFLMHIGLIIDHEGHLVVDTRAFLYEILYFGAVAKRKHELKKLRMEFHEVLLLVIMLRAGRTVPGVGFPSALLEMALRFYSEYLVDIVRKNPIVNSKKISSPSNVRRQITALAKRLWLIGSQLAPEQVSRVIANEDMFTLGARRRAGNSP
jgi:hypothetical protein